MRNARPSDLIDLCHVVEHGGIGAAARAIHRPKSSLSLAIRRLEDSLSVRLVDRTKRGFHLTDRGRILYEEIGPLLAQLDHITADFRAASGKIAGTLRIAAPYEFGAHHLAPVVESLVARNPQLTITLDVQYAPIKELFGSGYDIVFVMANGNLTDSSVVSRRVFMLERGLFASPGFLDRHPHIREPAHLAEVPLIAASQDVWWRFVDERNRAIEVPIGKPHFRSSNADIRRHLAIAGLGVTRTVGSFCAAAVRAGTLVEVLPEFHCAPLSVYGVIDDRRLVPVTVKALFDELDRVSPNLFIETRTPAPGARK